MRKTIGPGLAVAPTFEDTVGNPPAVKTPPPALKHSDVMDNPLCQSLFNSFRSIETTQEQRPKTQEPERPKRPGGPRKEPEAQEHEPLTFDPVVELTRLIRQRNEEQARLRKTAYANMLGL